MKIWDIDTCQCLYKVMLTVNYDNNGGYPLYMEMLESGVSVVISSSHRGHTHILDCYDTSQDSPATTECLSVSPSDSYDLSIICYCLCSLLDCDGFVIGYNDRESEPRKGKVGVYELTKIVSSRHDRFQIHLKTALEGYTRMVTDITTTIKGNLVSCTIDGTVVLYRRITNYCFEPARKFPVHGDRINSIISFPNGLGVVTLGGDNRLCYTVIEEKAYFTDGMYQMIIINIASLNDT